MSENPSSLEFFEAKYQESTDPWNFATSRYERNRYQAIIRALAPRRFRRAFEPGCSVGVLTKELAAICNHVDAIDISPTAAARARERCHGLSNVNVMQGAFPTAMPARSFDLIVLSEIGYYFPMDELSVVVSRLVEKMCAEGVLLAAHWLGNSRDHQLSGDEVHETIGKVDGLTLELSQRHREFRIDRWRRNER